LTRGVDRRAASISAKRLVRVTYRGRGDRRFASQRIGEVLRQMTVCPTGKSLSANPKKIAFVQPSAQKYFSSDFRKSML
jgi:hypothetical protein